MDDRSVANLHDVRGFIHSLVHMYAIQHASESDDRDPTVGADIRQSMFDIDNWNVWGLAEPFNYRENDRSPIMKGRAYQVSGGVPDYQTTSPCRATPTGSRDNRRGSVNQ
jgi:branched-chain amino acid transport system substrate-binding protein